MTVNFRPGHVVLAALAAGMACGASAAPTTFFGEDLSAAMSVPPDGKSLEQRNAFMAALVAGSDKSEGFETFSLGATAPLGLFGNAATLNMGDVGSGRIENRVTVGDETPGRFNTTADGANWWQASGSFTIEFGQLVSAFGFYGTDFGDFGGSLSLELILDGRVLETLVVPSTQSDPTQTTGDGDNLDANGSLLFFGFADAAQGYDSLRFVISQGGPSFDVLGFDDLVIGNVPRTNGVPEPTSLALVGLSLAALATTRRKRQR